jgi:hypothetical protein
MSIAASFDSLAQIWQADVEGEEDKGGQHVAQRSDRDSTIYFNGQRIMTDHEC